MLWLLPTFTRIRALPVLPALPTLPCLQDTPVVCLSFGFLGREYDVHADRLARSLIALPIPSSLTLMIRDITRSLEHAEHEPSTAQPEFSNLGLEADDFPCVLRSHLWYCSCWNANIGA